tara:strand:- start:18178 stop:19167 length:990 start_codon:yes stop_codon:yes gene_type:complete
MTDKDIYLSIIIPTYNRSKDLLRAISSFCNQKNFDYKYEIIVSDNNSSDNTKEIVQEYISNNPLNIIYYHFEPNQGVHYARNSAAKIASGKILYFTDDDMEADENLLNELISLFQLEPRLGTASGLVLPKFESNPPKWVQKNLINHYLSLTEPKIPFHLLISSDDFGVYSCHQAVRREVFFKAGGFNPENTKGVWLGDGETGLNIKIKSDNWLFGFNRKSIIHHHIPNSRMTLNYILKRMSNQGYSDSYSEYRKYRNLKKLIYKSLSRNIFAFPRTLLHFIRAIIGQRSFIMLLGRLFYYHSRNIYDMRIIFNADFRNIVLIDDWLIND